MKFFATLSLAFAASALGAFALSDALASKQSPYTRPSPVRSDTTQLVMLYFGKANCAWSNRSDMPKLVASAQAELSNTAAERGLHFLTVGVALDWTVAGGLDYLNRFEGFSEIAAGNSWSNGYALKYLQSDIPGPAATPQIVLIQRRIIAPSATQPHFAYDEEKVIARIVGYPEIEKWTSRGAPVPDWPSGSEPSKPHPFEDASDWWQPNHAVPDGASVFGVDSLN